MIIEFLYELFVKNLFCEVLIVISVINFEILKINFKLDDDDFIGDGEIVKEIEVIGDIVIFGRYKFKVLVLVFEMIFVVIDINLVQIVDWVFESGFVVKEKKVVFVLIFKVGEEYMLFYCIVDLVKEVVVVSFYKVIKDVVVDLYEDYC